MIIVELALDLFSFALIAHAAMSWFKVDDNHQFKLFVEKIVQPVLAPVKKAIPPFNGIDLSVVAVLFLIQFVKNYLL